MIGIIYKLTDNSDKVYYGSTKNKLHKRLSNHKNDGECMSRYMDSDSMQIECIEQYYFDTDIDYKPFLKKREGYYIRNFECINEKIPGRTTKESKAEYYEKNKEKIKLQSNEYYQKNKEKLKEKVTCKCGGKYTSPNKPRHNRSKKHQDFISQ